MASPSIPVRAKLRAVPSAPVRSEGLRISLLSEARGARRTRVRLRARPSLRLDLLAPETASHVKEAETGALGTSSRPPWQRTGSPHPIGAPTVRTADAE